MSLGLATRRLVAVWLACSTLCAAHVIAKDKQKPLRVYVGAFRDGVDEFVTEGRAKTPPLTCREL